MRIALAVALILSAAPLALAAEAKPPRTAEGTILSFECGDNCYLTIRSGGRKLTGLCTAKACEPWNDETQIPKKLIGKAVRVTITQGKQVDGEGNVMGETDAFSKIEFK
ncbi:hypothetical protein [Prosthecomicrobium hirschii]|uniref:hypothetical protein n=1 Tax=Prosthecodimorpha hirschii TaxID=665126 RepID=UPI00112A3630|nr:hypothetical protein [Prosthecomicrobium hirschii]MCW1843028.1 hypothetical protein [Prosthecomicrobium hirschii]TPQ52828.1 hypothetical protein C2U72_01120 [Prosthecomicrobium hirschii]